MTIKIYSRCAELGVELQHAMRKSGVETPDFLGTPNSESLFLSEIFFNFGPTLNEFLKGNFL